MEFKHHVRNFLSIMRDSEVRVPWYRCSDALRPARQRLHPGGGGDPTSQSRGVAMREGGSEGLGKLESQSREPRCESRENNVWTHGAEFQHQRNCASKYSNSLKLFYSTSFFKISDI